MNGKKKKIAVLASGTGTNAEKLFQYFKDHPEIEVSLLLSNKPDAPVTGKAASHKIPVHIFTRNEFNESLVLEVLKDNHIDFIVLAGFLWLIPGSWLKAYPNRIVNIHPALLPRYGGKEMYGSNVHRLVKENREVCTGITIHYLNDRYDEGEHILQVRCDIDPEKDSIEDIARKVQQLEWEHYPKVVEKLVREIGES